MNAHRNVSVVARKTGGTSGEFRIRPVEVIAGEKRTRTLYREGGCVFELDLNKTYFSPRLGTERGRLCELVKPGEKVLVPFAGVGPFAIRMGHAVPGAEVVGLELNPEACKFFRANVERNGCKNVQVLEGDVAKLLPGKYRGWADRLAMPLPKDAKQFLVNAIPCLKRGGMLHYYSFGGMEAPFEAAEKDVLDAAAKLGRTARVAFRRVVRPYSKNTEQVVVDVEIL
jgi:tRNA (guanine37-N1)-methyltransferase